MPDLSEKHKEIIALLIIKNWAGYNNSCNMTKLMERVYGIIDCKETMERLRSNEYVYFTLNGGVHFYELQEQGLKEIESNFESLKTMLDADFFGQGIDDEMKYRISNKILGLNNSEQ